MNVTHVQPLFFSPSFLDPSPIYPVIMKEIKHDLTGATVV